MSTDRDTFASYHPVVNFLYFAVMIIFSMLFMHPLCLIISFIAALSYALYLRGRRAVRFTLVYMLPLLLLTAFINVAFNHRGATILTYLPSGNPLTLESFIYGFAAALMMVTVILWFSCYNEVMTSDKFVYLFGRVIPALSLILSMTLRFVPRFKAQLAVVSQSRRSLGLGLEKNRLKRIKEGLAILSIMISWSLENSLDTADSMKSRGYGLPGRTSFSPYNFDKRDALAIVFILAGSVYLFVGAVSGGFAYCYFPRFFVVGVNAYTLSLGLFYLLLAVMPLMINVKEDRKWRHIRSQI